MPSVVQTALPLVLQRRRAQGDAGSGSYPSLHHVAYMLADNMVVIPAVDLAVEAVV
jgi:hypothetical protein